MSRHEEIVKHYEEHKEIVNFYKNKRMVMPEAIQEAFSRGYCAGAEELKERVDELEKERSEWKGKHSILKNKYKGLQRKMDSRWRYNRAVQNESRANKAVLEKFREEKDRYKQALEFYANKNNYIHDEWKPLNLNAKSIKMSQVEFDDGEKARQALEGTE